MLNQEFAKYLKRAKKVDIVSDDLFNVAGYFWINLTDRQGKIMYNLMISQGAVEIGNMIRLKNGLGIIANFKKEKV